MFQKILGVFFAFCLVFPLFLTAQAAEPDSAEKSLEAQFDSYTASTFQKNASGDAFAQLLDLALSGEESTVFYCETDSVTSTIFLSDLFRTYVLDVLPQFIAYMENNGQSRLLAGGDIGWHDYMFDYHAEIFDWNASIRTEDDSLISTLFYRANVSCNPNRNDEILSLMVGSARVRIRIEKTAVAFSGITYRLHFTVSDDFNFDGDYEEEKDQGFDTSLSDYLNNLGILMELHPYSWYASADFELVLPNSCTHEIAPGQNTCTHCGAAETVLWLPGDADGNNILNYNDALLVLRCSIGLETLSPEAAVACDMDGSGSLSYNDALIILRRSIGLE